MPVQVARRRANSRRGSRLGRRKKRGRTVNFNDELGATARPVKRIILGMDPEAIAKTALAAWASKDTMAKVLGPTADYLGGEVARFAAKCNINIGEMFQRAVRKIGP